MLKQFISFRVNQRDFGIDIHLVREVQTQPSVTPVPRAPEFIRGLMSLRGHLVTVIDLRRRLGLEAQAIGPDTACIVLKTCEELTGMLRGDQPHEMSIEDRVALLVDAVGDVVEADESQIEPPPANATGPESRFLSGVVKLDNALIATHDVSALLMEEGNTGS